MASPLFPALSLFLAATAGRNMTRPAYLAVAVGVCVMVLLTVDPAYEAAHHWVDAVLWACLAFFVFEWVVRLRHAVKSERGLVYSLSFRGLVDLVAAAAIPVALVVGANPKSAWLLGVLWLLKLVPGIPGPAPAPPGAGGGIRPAVFRAGDLPDGGVPRLGRRAFPRTRRPADQTFGSVPAALWWAVVTLTTTGYGDVVPVTPLGRLVAALVMISGLGVFGLWTGILATGFAAETRRDNFLKTWESVSKVPFFAVARTGRDRRRHQHAAHHGPAAAHHDHPQGPAGRLHVFHRRRRGGGRPARRQEGAARRRRLLRRDGPARQHHAQRQHHDDAACRASWCSTSSTSAC